MNHTTFVGNLTADPEVSFGKDGKAMARFTVAETPRHRDAKGKWTDGETTFFNCAAWGKLAENIADSLTKGNRVVVSATTTQREIAGKDGRKTRYTNHNVTAIGPDLTFATVTITKAGTRPASQAEPTSEQGDEGWPA